MTYDPKKAMALAEAMSAAGYVAPGRKLVVLRDSVETRTAGGLIIPDTATKMTRRGVVLMRGLACELAVSQGDRCVLQVYEATETELSIGGAKFDVEIIDERDVLLTWPGGWRREVGAEVETQEGS